MKNAKIRFDSLFHVKRGVIAWIDQAAQTRWLDKGLILFIIFPAGN
jgi:hypothetical protein